MIFAGVLRVKTIYDAQFDTVFMYTSTRPVIFLTMTYNFEPNQFIKKGLIIRIFVQSFSVILDS